MVLVMPFTRFPTRVLLLLKELARDLAREKGKEREFAFLELLEERAIATFGRVKNNGQDGIEQR